METIKNLAMEIDQLTDQSRKLSHEAMAKINPLHEQRHKLIDKIRGMYLEHINQYRGKYYRIKPEYAKEKGFVSFDTFMILGFPDIDHIYQNYIPIMRIRRHHGLLPRSVYFEIDYFDLELPRVKCYDYPDFDAFDQFIENCDEITREEFDATALEWIHKSIESRMRPPIDIQNDDDMSDAVDVLKEDEDETK